jgi:energy-coupling factor transporter transmembrane protein EcfT
MKKYIREFVFLLIVFAVIAIIFITRHIPVSLRTISDATFFASLPILAIGWVNFLFNKKSYAKGANILGEYKKETAENEKNDGYKSWLIVGGTLFVLSLISMLINM